MNDGNGITLITQKAIQYIQNNLILVPIEEGTKGPTRTGWQMFDRCVSHVDQVNGHIGGWGLAHAYSRTMALDIDDWARAVAWFAGFGVDLRELFHRGDAVIIKGRDGRGKLLYRLPEGLAPVRTKSISIDGVMVVEFRCATASGSTVQDVLPPSIHPDTGRPYEWAGAGDWRALPELPVELLEIWQNLVARVDKPKRERDEDVNMGEVESALMSIDPNGLDYDQWLEVMMAVNATGDEGAQELFETWSAGSGADVPRTTAYKWRSLDEEGDIGPGTLFRRAKEGGWRLRPELTNQRMFGYEIEEGVGVEAGTGGSVDDSESVDDSGAPDEVYKYMYLKDLDLFINTERDKFMKPEQLNRIYPAKKSTWVRDFFEAKKVFGYDVANGITYLPNGPRVHGGDYNVWKGPTLKPIEGDVSLWLNLLERLVPDSTERLHLLQWMGFTVQRTGEKINHAVLMVSDVEGVGKDSLFAPLIQAIGDHNCEDIFATSLQPGGYNSFLTEAKLMIIQEIMDWKKGETANYLKPMLASPPTRIEINEKYTKRFSIPNICQFIMFSNNLDAVYVAKSDRRYFCLRCDCSPIGDQGPILWDWYRGGGFARVAHYLANVDLTGFDPNQAPPMTQYKEELIESSRPDVDLTIEGYMDAHREFAIFKLRELGSRLGEHRFSQKQLSISLKRLKFTSHNSSGTRFWTHPDVKDKTVTLYKKELAKAKKIEKGK